MKYRKLTTKSKDDPTYTLRDDYIFGHGTPTDFYEDVPQTIAQAVVTRLRLFTNEWYMDETDGTPYNPEVLGKFTKLKYDNAIRTRITNTEGVNKILHYTSTLDRENRKLTIDCEVETIYGDEPYIIQQELQLPLFGK